MIKGHIGDNSRIGAGCRIAGDLIHRQFDPSIPWDDRLGEEPALVVEDGAFVGWRAVIVGGVNIGAGAYVCAGALVTKDIPAGSIACGRRDHASGAPGQARSGNPPSSRTRVAPDRSGSGTGAPSRGRITPGATWEIPGQRGRGVVTCEPGAPSAT